jgi:nickel/cobalt transporter (NicO) family protein
VRKRITTVKKIDSFLTILLLVLAALMSGAVMPVAAHSLGNVVQKTVVSELTDSILIEYNTHFGLEILLVLHSDIDFNGVLDETKKSELLDRINRLLLPNIICKLGNRVLTFQEMDRKLILDYVGDFANGLTTQFVWRISLTKEERKAEGLFSIEDNNFRDGELNQQLSYFITVQSDTGPMSLSDEGRQLIWDMSGEKKTSRGPQGAMPDISLPAVGSTTGAMKNNKVINTGIDFLRSFLRNPSGSIGMYLVGFVTAFVLGSLHALSPGHGKAMVAAYLVGSQGRALDAVRLGLIVTMTHILSVIILGIVALIISRYTMSRNLLPWLGVASGAIIFMTGYFLLARTALNAGRHHHDGHEHHHTDDDIRTKATYYHSHSLYEVVSLGVAGGLVPCPTAIVILLFAIAVNHIAIGLLIVLSFSLGLAAVLVIIGILTVTTSRRLEKFGSTRDWIKHLPVFTAGIIMVLGVAIGLNALFQAGILTFKL